MKNTLQKINSKLNEAEEWIGNLKDKVVEITKLEQRKKKKN